MTTIAYKDGILAFDGLITSAEAVISRNAIKGIATNTHLAGSAGAFGHIQAFLAWVKAGRPPVDVPKDHDGKTGEISGIVVDRRGVITEYYQGLMPIVLGKQPFCATGSGRDYALGAMACGATALEAVQAATKFDVYSGGRVRSVSFK